LSTPKNAELWPVNGYTLVATDDASPYEMTLGALGTKTTTTITAICDDVVDAFATSPTVVLTTDLSGITGGTSSVYYGGDSGAVLYGEAGGTSADLSQTEKYVAAADLAVTLEGLDYESTDAADAEREELSLAIWDIFNPTYGQLDTDLSDSSSSGAPSSSQPYTLAAVQGYLSAAIAVACGGSTTTCATDGITGTAFEQQAGVDITIYTPVILGKNDATSFTTGDQEFIYLSPLPEPSTWAFLGFDFAGAGLVGLYFVRRKARARS